MPATVSTGVSARNGNSRASYFLLGIYLLGYFLLGIYNRSVAEWSLAAIFPSALEFSLRQGRGVSYARLDFFAGF